MIKMSTLANKKYLTLYPKWKVSKAQIMENNFLDRDLSENELLFNNVS